MMTNIKPIYTIIIGILISMLSACSGDNADLMKYIHDIKSRPGRPIEPIPQFSPLPIFRFPDEENRRNPFKPIEVKKNNDGEAPDSKRQKQPLEAFPLDALKFVGILKQGSDIWALIKQPDNQITRVRVGDYMGQNYGKVISITNTTIKLQETLKSTGKWEKQITTIKLDTGKE